MERNWGFGRRPTHVGWWATVEWALLLYCGGPLGDAECGYARDFVHLSTVICMVTPIIHVMLHLDP